MNFETNKIQFYVDVVRYLDKVYPEASVRIEGDYIIFNNLYISLEPDAYNRVLIRIECMKTGVVVEDTVLWFNMIGDIDITIAELLVDLKLAQEHRAAAIKTSVIEMLSEVFTQEENVERDGYKCTWFVNSNATVHLLTTDSETVKLSLVIKVDDGNVFEVEKTFPVKGLTPTVIAHAVIQSFKQDAQLLT